MPHLRPPGFGVGPGSNAETQQVGFGLSCLPMRPIQQKKGSSGNPGKKELPTTENAESAEARRDGAHAPCSTAPSALSRSSPSIPGYEAFPTQALRPFSALLSSSVFLRVPSFLFSHPLPVFLCILCDETSFPEIPEDPFFSGAWPITRKGFLCAPLLSPLFSASVFWAINSRVRDWCARGDSNPHALRQRILSPVRLPFRHGRAGPA